MAFLVIIFGLIMGANIESKNEALEKYVKYSLDMNAVLWSGIGDSTILLREGPGRDVYKNIRRHIDDILSIDGKMGGAGKDMTVYRGCKRGVGFESKALQLNNCDIDEAKKTADGKRSVDMKSFVSTTSEYMIALKFMRGILLEINVPKGFPVIDVDSVRQESWEKEFLLRFAKWDIQSVECVELDEKTFQHNMKKFVKITLGNPKELNVYDLLLDSLNDLRQGKDVPEYVDDIKQDRVDELIQYVNDRRAEKADEQNNSSNEVVEKGESKPPVGKLRSLAKELAKCVSQVASNLKTKSAESDDLISE